jgi:anti-sigma factor RsiW
MDYNCQECGFKVFNRRYPKCESCGAALAQGVALSTTERSALFEEDRVAAEAKWLAEQKLWAQPAAGGAPALVGGETGGSGHADGGY